MRRSRLSAAPAPTLAVVVLAALGAVGVLGACSGDDGGSGSGDGSPRATLVAAVGRAFESGTAEFSLQAGVRGLAGDGATVAVTGEGVLDARGGRVSATADVTELFASVADSLNLPALLGSLFDDPVDLVSDGVSLYLRLPVLALASGSSADWARIDLAELGGGGAGALAAASDPVTLFGVVHGISEVTEAGDDEVRGDAVTRFEGQFTFAAALEDAPEEVRTRLGPAVDALGLDEEQRRAPVPFEAWVDAEGRLRALAVAFTPDGPDSGADLRIELFGFGVDAEIEVPEDSADATDLFARLG